MGTFCSLPLPSYPTCKVEGLSLKSTQGHQLHLVRQKDNGVVSHKHKQKLLGRTMVMLFGEHIPDVACSFGDDTESRLTKLCSSCGESRKTWGAFRGFTHDEVAMTNQAAAVVYCGTLSFTSGASCYVHCDN